MFEHTEIIVGLEIGTAKVCALVGECDGEGGLNLIGIGTAPSGGSVRKGEVINPGLAEEAIRAALGAAEEDANVEIGSVYLGITGAHISSINRSGVHPIPTVDREIDEADLVRVKENASPQLTADHELLHSVRQNYRVDGQDGVDNPLGRFASRLEVDVHHVIGQTTRIQNPVRVVKSLGIDVEDVAFTGRAVAMAAVTPTLGEQGVVVIDLGAGATEYTAFINGTHRHSGVFAVGGEHVTNDISVGLKLSQSRAEKLKLEHGSAVVDPRMAGRMVNFSSDVGFNDKAASVGHLHQVMNARLDELLRLIRNDLGANGILDRIQGGVILTGGGARTLHLDLLAREVFELDIITGHAVRENGPESILNQPEFAAAIGLVKYGAQHAAEQSRSRGGIFGWLVGR